MKLHAQPLLTFWWVGCKLYSSQGWDSVLTPLGFELFLLLVPNFESGDSGSAFRRVREICSFHHFTCTDLLPFSCLEYVYWKGTHWILFICLANKQLHICLFELWRSVKICDYCEGFSNSPRSFRCNIFGSASLFWRTSLQMLILFQRSISQLLIYFKNQKQLFVFLALKYVTILVWSKYD